MRHLLEMRNISKDYPGVKVLDDISFSAEGGEVLALMGENGAGKSTLMKILMGIAQADRGEIFLEGNKEQFQSPKAAMDKGIVMIHQELNVLLDMEVSENIFLGREIKKSPELRGFNFVTSGISTFRVLLASFPFLSLAVMRTV